MVKFKHWYVPKKDENFVFVNVRSSFYLCYIFVTFLLFSSWKLLKINCLLFVLFGLWITTKWLSKLKLNDFCLFFRLSHVQVQLDPSHRQGDRPHSDRGLRRRSLDKTLLRLRGWKHLVKIWTKMLFPNIFKFYI